MPTRMEAYELLSQYTTSTALINHARSVESVLRYIARKYSEDEEKWGVIGLIHDLDYERFPGQHCQRVRRILEENGWPEEYIRAVESHGWEICSDVKPETLLEKTLYAVDELTGLITACALVRPSKSVMDLTVESVMKKWKQPRFAGGVNRDIIMRGAALLGADLHSLVADVIMGMRQVACEIGL